MPATRLRIFISSVQNEFAQIRLDLKAFLLGNASLYHFVADVFLFEELPDKDRRADEVYLEELERCDIYLGIFGYKYGLKDKNGVSPTEHEYDLATELGKTRLIYVWGSDEKKRADKMRALVRKVSSEPIRRRVDDVSALTAEVYANLVDYLRGIGALRVLPTTATAGAERVVRRTPSSLLKYGVKNDYSNMEQQFEAQGGSFVDFGEANLVRFPQQQRERKKTERNALLTRFLWHETDMPTLAVVVNVAQRPRVFPDVLRSLGLQSFVQEHPASVEVVLVQDGPEGVLDDAARPYLLDALKEFPHEVGLKGFRLDAHGARPRGRATARNVGLWHASRSTKVVMFLDDAMILHQGFIAEHMLRHASITFPVALLGFKEDLEFADIDEYTRARDQIMAGRPNYEKDWKWLHCLKEDEVIFAHSQSFTYKGKEYGLGSAIRYMAITDNLKDLHGEEAIGHRSLPMFFHTGLTSVTYDVVRAVGGFEPTFDVGMWGFEDSYLGLLLALKGVKLVPCPSSVAYKVEFKDEKRVEDKEFHIAHQRQTFWECADKDWTSYDEGKLRKQIQKLKKQGLLETVMLSPD